MDGTEPPRRLAKLSVDLAVLSDLLGMPADVSVVSVQQCGDDAALGRCTIHVEGDGLPVTYDVEPGGEVQWLGVAYQSKQSLEFVGFTE